MPMASGAGGFAYDENMWQPMLDLTNEMQGAYTTDGINFIPYAYTDAERLAAAEMPTVTMEQWNASAVSEDQAIAYQEAMREQQLYPPVEVPLIGEIPPGQIPSTVPGAWQDETGKWWYPESGLGTTYSPTATAGLNEVKMPDGTTQYLSDDDVMGLLVLLILLIRQSKGG